MTPQEYLYAVRDLVLPRLTQEEQEKVRAATLLWNDMFGGLKTYAWTSFKKNYIEICALNDIPHDKVVVAFDLIHEIAHVISEDHDDFLWLVITNGGHHQEWRNNVHRLGLNHDEGRGPWHIACEEWRWDPALLSAVKALPEPEWEVRDTMSHVR